MSGTVSMKYILVPLKTLTEDYGLSGILYFCVISCLIPMEPNHMEDDRNNSSKDILFYYLDSLCQTVFYSKWYKLDASKTKCVLFS